MTIWAPSKLADYFAHQQTIDDLIAEGIWPVSLRERQAARDAILDIAEQMDDDSVTLDFLTQQVEIAELNRQYLRDWFAEDGGDDPDAPTLDDAPEPMR